MSLCLCLLHLPKGGHHQDKTPHTHTLALAHAPSPPGPFLVCGRAGGCASNGEGVHLQGLRPHASCCSAVALLYPGSTQEHGPWSATCPPQSSTPQQLLRHSQLGLGSCIFNLQPLPLTSLPILHRSPSSSPASRLLACSCSCSCSLNSIITHLLYIPIPLPALVNSHTRTDRKGRQRTRLRQTEQTDQLHSSSQLCLGNCLKLRR